MSSKGASDKKSPPGGTFVSLQSPSCETKTILWNNKHEINLMWLGTRRANSPSVAYFWLLKLPMTKFFLAVMGFQAGETFYQRLVNSFSMLRQHSVIHYRNTFGAVSNAQYVMYQRSFGLEGNVHTAFSVEHFSRCHTHHISSCIINHCIVALILVVCIIPYVDISMCVSALSSLLPYNKTTLPALSPSPRACRQS